MAPQEIVNKCRFCEFHCDARRKNALVLEAGIVTETVVPLVVGVNATGDQDPAPVKSVAD
jgi:hypothetical protein